MSFSSDALSIERKGAGEHVAVFRFAVLLDNALVGHDGNDVVVRRDDILEERGGCGARRVADPAPFFSPALRVRFCHRRRGGGGPCRGGRIRGAV